MQKQLSPDELRDQLIELWHQRINGKINDSRMRKEMLVLLESNTVNTTAKNQHVINDFLKAAKAVCDVKSSLNAVSGMRKMM